jgi:hypothetical protein
MESEFHKLLRELGLSEASILRVYAYVELSISDKTRALSEANAAFQEQNNISRKLLLRAKDALASSDPFIYADVGTRIAAYLNTSK